jgi:hypothetical protein
MPSYLLAMAFLTIGGCLWLQQPGTTSLTNLTSPLQSFLHLLLLLLLLLLFSPDCHLIAFFHIHPLFSPNCHVSGFFRIHLKAVATRSHRNFQSAFIMLHITTTHVDILAAAAAGALS